LPAPNSHHSERSTAGARSRDQAPHRAANAQLRNGRSLDAVQLRLTSIGLTGLCNHLAQLAGGDDSSRHWRWLRLRLSRSWLCRA